MASAAVVVVPSRKEAFGLVVLEAWRAGAPLIVTSNGGPADLVTDGETGLVVDPEDATALARALELMVRDRATAERFSEAGRVAVRAFPWSRVAELYESCYDGGFGVSPQWTAYDSVPRRRARALARLARPVLTPAFYPTVGVTLRVLVGRAPELRGCPDTVAVRAVRADRGPHGPSRRPRCRGRKHPRTADT